MGEIFANRVSEKGLISGVYEQLLEINSKKANNTMKKWAKVLNTHSSKADTQKVSRYMKKA